MSDEYTPTKEEVQSRYVYAADFTVSEEVDAWGEFDRWLAAHDAEVRADEREKAAQRVAAVEHWSQERDWDTDRDWQVMPYDYAVAAAREDGEQDA